MGKISDGILKIEERTNRYIRQGLIPLGTKRPYDEYVREKKRITDDDIVFLPVDKGKGVL